MINRKSKEITANLQDINAFHFVCPRDRELEAREILDQMDGVLLFPETKPVNHQIFGTNRRLVGNMVGGICYPWMTDQLRAQLAGRQIVDVDPDTEIRILKQRELRDAYGTVTGYRKWLRRM